MKKFYFLIMAMFIAMMPIVLVSCGDDDDEEKMLEAIEKANTAVIQVTVISSDSNEAIAGKKVYYYENPSDDFEIGNVTSGEGASGSEKTDSKGVATFEFTGQERTVIVAIFADDQGNWVASQKLTTTLGKTQTVTLKE